MRLLLTLYSLLCVAIVRADLVLVSYSFSGLRGNEPELAPEHITQGLEASALRRGKGLVHVSEVRNSFAASGWTTAAQKNDTDYYEFQIIPVNGLLTLKSIRFDEFSSEKGPEYFSVRSSLDDFTTNIVGPIQRDPETLGGAHSISLNEKFQKLQDPITFRIIAWGAQSGAGLWALGGNARQPSKLTISGVLVK